MLRPAAFIALFTALVLSGVAGIVNQVVWQRALKIFLGGSETLSSMVVVLVFMGGLGLGAALAAAGVDRLRRPLMALAAVELGLALVNAGVAGLLGLDIADSVYAAQRLAVSAGVPLRAVYAVASIAVLLVPTALMGTTVPLASEACQRQLGAPSSRLVPLLLFVNTLGAAAGALGASLWLLPLHGQRLTLLAAVGLNAAAGLIALAGAARLAPATTTDRSAAPRAWGIRRDEALGGALGFLALGYEMVLLRTLVLANMPLPYTFAAGLCAFLVAWSLGMALAGRLRGGVVPIAALTALAVAATPALLAWDVQWGLGLPLGAALYAAPALGFGALYGLLVARTARSWGRDVGRYQAINTVGSCAGIAAFTLVGYELPLDLVSFALAAAIGALGLTELPRRPWGAAVGALAAVAVGLLIRGALTPYTEDHWGRTYWGRDGVVEITPTHDVYIDGLWHTKLTDGVDHLGRPYSWVMATAAVVAHGDPERALVVGAGVGISSVTLAGAAGLSVDGYEINHTLKRVLADYPAETLHAAAAPGVRWIWQDARTGLALTDTRYDVILSAPLHLKQAGSSLLLSREYLELARSRLADGGVLAVYSNEGEGLQAELVQHTIHSVFPYTMSWYDGIVTVASMQPLAVTRATVEARMAIDDRLGREMRIVDASIRDAGGTGLWDWVDPPAAVGRVADRVITDDQPLVEYPELIYSRVQLLPAAPPP